MVTKGCPYCDGAVHLVRGDLCWRCSGCTEEWSFEEEGWEDPTPKLFAVQYWMEDERGTASLDSVWDTEGKASKRLEYVLSTHNYKDELIGEVTPLEVNSIL